MLELDEEISMFFFFPFGKVAADFLSFFLCRSRGCFKRRRWTLAIVLSICVRRVKKQSWVARAGGKRGAGQKGKGALLERLLWHAIPRGALLFSSHVPWCEMAAPWVLCARHMKKARVTHVF
jgi:hypothetical protein